MVDITRILSDNLRRIRKESDLTQSELAEAIDVSKTSIQNYESGRAWPGIDIIEDLSTVLKTPDHKFFEKDPPPTVESLIEAVMHQEAEIKSLRNKLASIQPEIIEALSKAPHRKQEQVRAALGLPIYITVRRYEKKKN
jgi:transcriptional regulator with XRE-family HTH domain